MFQKILVANRGEIAIRVLRAATELNIKTIAIYTFEDRYSLHRYKADEAYQIGKNDDPLKPYLDIEEIISVAKREKADAIHPGYGFLSENAVFATRCQEENIVFIGPRPEVMEQLGDKIAAKLVARKANVPMIEDSKGEMKDISFAKKEANRIGYPIIIKAAAGGGGRGMRVVKSDEQLEKSLPEARNEAKTAFGNDTVFFEKFIESPKHIEVQILGDSHGNIIHLFERDCSVQRRFQKVVEMAPAISLKPETRHQLHQYAINICKSVNYNNAGTVEFLVDKAENIFFIEVNPRIQVEHTVTEEVTGIDIVKNQILIAKGYALTSPEINIQSQEQLSVSGVAIQCRVTTEDPSNNFKPDYGTLMAYRNAGGPGIRLDEGSSYPGVNISPFFDSLLVKITASGRNLIETCDRLVRTLKEFRIRGVKTNIVFLENVLQNTTFQSGQATVDFIDNHPSLFELAARQDRGTKALQYIAEVIVNGNPDVSKTNPSISFRTPVLPDYDNHSPIPKGSKDRLNELGRDKFIQWLKDSKSIQYTDTTFRDAHQSLLATRVRTTDMLKVADAVANNHPQLFSLEMWGGATFDVALRFLHECPWHRLQLLREHIPNTLFQMLIRGSNAVGYTAYPDNLVEIFIEQSWKKGIDIFRIFDSLNWMDGMLVSIKAVRERTNGLAEACICYTGDFLDNTRNQKFNLQYYLDLARKLEDAGAHILGIKDMAGLLKPVQAKILVSELKKVLQIPVHLHTHDTSSIQAATYLNAIEAGVDVVDVALASMSGLTSQPNFNAIASMMKGHPRELPMDIERLNDLSNYWEDVREYYYPFESQLKAGTAEVFDHEIPGGQYSNLRPQARSLGLEHKFQEIKKNYVVVNKMFGDIVKVTPSSKVVGDMALFMTANGYNEKDIMDKGESISFPDSVIGLLKGDLGQTPGGFPQQLQKIILKNEKPYTDRPNAHMQPLNMDKEKQKFTDKYGKQYDDLDLLSYLFYPRVFDEYHQFRTQYGEVYYIPSPVFFFGLKPNEETLIELAPGKSILVKFLYMSETDDGGFKKVFFNLNGQTRAINVKDKSYTVTKAVHKKVSAEQEIGAPLQGKLSKILVKAGDKVAKNAPLFVIEAMKMESTIVAPKETTIKSVVLPEGVLVEQDDVVMELGSPDGTPFLFTFGNNLSKTLFRMSADNYFIADQFSLLSKLMDIHGENSFKSKSYSIAAFTIEKLPQQVADLPADKLSSIKGIGDSAAKKIVEILQTGQLTVLQDIIQKTPPGLIEMLNIKGIGPKKIATIWKEMNIESIGELLYACNENRLLLYKGFGEKTQKNVQESIEFYMRNQGSHLYADIETYALTIDKTLKEQFPAKKFEITGPFRRQAEIIDSLEWVTTATTDELLSFLGANNFTTKETLADVISVTGTENVLLKFYSTSDDLFYKTLFTSTGSNEFNEAWQSLPEWNNSTSFQSEEDIFKSVNLPYIVPALREKSTVPETIKKNGASKLIEPGDIKAIIHSHSDWSDGSNTVEEMAKACIAKGYEYMVISDHSKSAFYAKGLSEERIREQHHYVDELNSKLKPFRIFKSIECDILNDGALDYSDNVLATFDLIIASVHSNLKMTEEKAMMRLMNAIRNPYTTILGHMTGRLLLSRPGYPVDHVTIVDACVEHQVAIELNAHPRRLDIDWRWIDYALEKGVLISVDPDAHSVDGYDDCRFGVLAAQKGGLTKERNLSSFSLAAFESYLEKRRKDKKI